MSDEATAAAVQLLDREVLQHGVQEKEVGSRTRRRKLSAGHLV